MDSSAKRIVSIGKLQMTLPSVMVAITGFATALVIAWKVHPIMGLAILPGFFLAAYNVKCVTVGQCTTWAWILTSMYIFYAGIVFVMALTKSFVMSAAFDKTMKLK